MNESAAERMHDMNMRVASDAKSKYKGELMTIRQWMKKGYAPKDGEKPHKMWPNRRSYRYGNPNNVYDYYYDFQMKKVF